MRILLPVFVILISACFPKYLAIQQPADINRIVATIHNHNESIRQIRAKLDVKAAGIMASFVREQADIVVQKPHYMLWSIRSFFGPPSMIVASDGVNVTALDFSGGLDDNFLQLPLTRATSFKFLDINLHPQSLIALFLVQIPVENASSFELSADGDKVLVHAVMSDGFTSKTIFDRVSMHVEKTEIKNDDLSIFYEARYLNYELIAGIYFPRSMVLFAKGKARSAKLTIEFAEIQINGDELNSDVFKIDQH